MPKDIFDNRIPEIIEHRNECRLAEHGYVFSSISDVIGFIEKFDTSECFFRGQSGLWDITSSLHRHYKEPQNYKKACNIVGYALRWLKSNKYIKQVVNDNDDIALAMAQHYGCPTDLIDITTNYRTAAYFATSKTATSLGCVWIFTKHDVEKLRVILKKDYYGCFSALPKNLQDKLAQSNYSQLININIPELSRLNAQDGMFLWDVAGLLKQQLEWQDIGTRLVFNHTSNETDLFTEEDGRLFPFPNQLESEIMRIFTEKSRTDGLPNYIGNIDIAVNESEGILKNGLLAEIVDNADGSFFIPFPDFFTPSFGEYSWIKRTVTQSAFDSKMVDMNNYLECHLPLSIEGTLSLTKHIIKSVKDNTLTDLLILFYNDGKMYPIRDGDEPLLVEIVLTLRNYLYNEDEIAEVILEWMKMLIFKVENNFITSADLEMEFALINGHVNDWVSRYYGCRVTKLNLRELDTESITKFWLPERYDFLDEKCKNEFSTFASDYTMFPNVVQPYCKSLAENAKIFLYQHQPQKILSYASMKKMFIELVLPQHFAFRRPSEKIYVPDFVTDIYLPIFGRQFYGMKGNISETMDAVGSFFVI